MSAHGSAGWTACELASAPEAAFIIDQAVLVKHQVQARGLSPLTIRHSIFIWMSLFNIACSRQAATAIEPTSSKIVSTSSRTFIFHSSSKSFVADAIRRQ